MSKTGRKPKPSELKDLQGNPGKRKENENEPKPDREEKLPSAPRTLNKDGKKEWRRTGKELFRLGLLTKLDMTAFEAYCASYALWSAAYKIVIDEGFFKITEKGYSIQHPALAIANKQAKIMKDYLVEFGMTPSSRTRVKIEPPKKQDGIGGFIKNGKPNLKAV